MRIRWEIIKCSKFTKEANFVFFLVSEVGTYHHKQGTTSRIFGVLGPWAAPFNVAYGFSPISAVLGAGTNSIFRPCGGERRCEIVGHQKFARWCFVVTSTHPRNEKKMVFSWHLFSEFCIFAFHPEVIFYPEVRKYPVR